MANLKNGISHNIKVKCYSPEVTLTSVVDKDTGHHYCELNMPARVQYVLSISYVYYCQPSLLLTVSVSDNKNSYSFKKEETIFLEFLSLPSTVVFLVGHFNMVR